MSIPWPPFLACDVWGVEKDECTRISSSRGPSEDDSGHDYTTWPIIRWNNWTSFSYHPLWFLLNSPLFCLSGLNRFLLDCSRSFFTCHLLDTHINILLSCY
ncbi:hypothetical protein CDAR_303511 [Caerostris darwini]|uniref:Uncharacterized protein n=1 Tax=Caerostris darwini TaxID=1538125 RepID=A0AAV4WW98_9ARAC|nr:hypothetical protein CDAR_303511 [Caerostris darwini]